MDGWIVDCQRSSFVRSFVRSLVFVRSFVVTHSQSLNESQSQAASFTSFASFASLRFASFASFVRFVRSFAAFYHFRRQLLRSNCKVVGSVLYCSVAVSQCRVASFRGGGGCCVRSVRRFVALLCRGPRSVGRSVVVGRSVTSRGGTTRRCSSPAVVVAAAVAVVIVVEVARSGSLSNSFFVVALTTAVQCLPSSFGYVTDVGSIATHLSARSLLDGTSTRV